MRVSAKVAIVLALSMVLAACAGSAADDPTTTTEDAATTTEGTTAVTDTSAATTTTEDAVTTTTEDEDEDGDGATASITIVNFSFSGPETVEVGTTVTATNEDGFSHTWTSEDYVWDSGNLSSGESFEFTFDEPGEYAFFCEIHPSMRGTITVEE